MISRFWTSAAIAAVLLTLAAGLVAPATASAQGTPTPTPTATPITTGSMTTSAWYTAMKIKVDDFFSGIQEWFTQAEAVIVNLTTVATAVAGLMITGNMQIGDQSWSMNDLTTEIAEPVQQFFIFRCYVDSPVVNWALIFLAWIVVVILIKLAISMIPYAMSVIDFLWGKVVDLWQSIPFI